MRMEFQLTFEEFGEAMRLARRGLIRDIRRRSRAERWIGIVVLILVLLFAMNVVDLVLVTPPGAGPKPSPPWQDALRPYVSFLVIIWLTLLAALLHIRRRTKLLDRIGWESRPQLQQVRTIDFADSGVTITDALSRTEYRWTIFRRIDETKNTLVLFVSDYSFEVLPKRALTPVAEGELRRLLAQQVQPQTAAFPVLPVEPLPMPPLPRNPQSPNSASPS